MNDEQLHQHLRENPASISLPETFSREVWTRIEAAEDASAHAGFSQLWKAWLGALARPVPALATVAACMLLGGGVGWVKQRGESRVRGEIAYAQSINPFFRTADRVSP
ncbi:hypothetical protein [Prosthecobacter sp.]|uniref:hypothetical protein n=1 Tax=Prosthecobacter sp. TaxID=1965333 RepID=UPI0037840BDC